MNPHRELSPLQKRVVQVCLALIVLYAAAVYMYAASLHAPIVDEAVFGRASLEILGGDTFLTGWRVMKPPVVYYAQAAARAMLGPTAFAGRLPGLLATIGCLLLLYRLGRRWFGEVAGLLSVALMAASPYLVEHFPTGRTDAVALFFILLAVDLAWSRRLGWAGFAYAISFSTRQLAALSFPIVMAFAMLAEHLHADEKRPPLKLAWYVTWTFFKGTLPVLAVLAVWSTFERIPFAWLVNELQLEKYHEGEHVSLGAWDKLRHWLSGSRRFFVFWPLLLAALAGWGAGLVFLATRAAKKWRAVDDPARAVVAVLAAFVLFFYAAHTMKWLTTYWRFLVPVTPWVFLLGGWALALLLRYVDRGWAWSGVLLAPVLALSFLVPMTIAFGTGLSPLQQPVPEDDVPRVVRWLEDNAAPDAIVFNRKFGPEFDYATYGTRLKHKQLVQQPEKLKPYALSKLDRELFLFLSHKHRNEWLAFLNRDLAPVFHLEVVDLPLQRSDLYRVKVVDAGGVTAGEIAYLDGAAMVREPLTCNVLRRLFEQALSDSKPVAFAWQVCDPNATPGILAWQVGHFPVGGMRVAKAGFYYDAPRIDWSALTVAHRLVIHQSKRAHAEFMLTAEHLAEYAARKNKNLDNLKFIVESDGVLLRAQVKLPGWQPQLEARGSLELRGDHVYFRLREASLDGVRPPKFVLEYAEKVMNPAFKLDLRRWGLQAASVRYAAFPANAVVVTAQARD